MRCPDVGVTQGVDRVPALLVNADPEDVRACATCAGLNHTLCRESSPDLGNESPSGHMRVHSGRIMARVAGCEVRPDDIVRLAQSRKLLSVGSRCVRQTGPYILVRMLPHLGTPRFGAGVEDCVRRLHRFARKIPQSAGFNSGPADAGGKAIATRRWSGPLRLHSPLLRSHESDRRLCT